MAEYEWDIVVFDKEGKRLRSIERSKHQVEQLRSVAVDSEDNFYFIGTRNNILGKSNRNCDKFQVREVQQVKGPGYLDIAVVGDEVMVTECNNEGLIMVYDRELNYVRQITSRNKTLLRHVHADHHGNLYISDRCKNIQVLSKTGEFLLSFSRDHNGVEMLKEPSVVHVSGPYVFVADISLKKTVVFTNKGEYMTTFASFGGICVDQDGVLYIGEYYNNKISCHYLCN